MAEDLIDWSELSDFEEIGHGSFGQVFRADYLGTEVAVKEFLHIGQGFDFKKYMTREMTILKESRHPNVTIFMGVSQNGDKLYMVTEYVPGGDLKSYLEDTSKTWTWRQVISFATDVARALAYLHAHNIIHRDLKPTNLLLTENKRIKICDFGFARQTAKSKEDKRAMSYCGTDAYMAPEIVLGMEFSVEVDIFSYGIVLAELATRRIADPDHHIKRVIPGFGVDADEIRGAVPSDCPPDFLNLILECTEDDPEKRPQLKEVLKRLRAVEAELPAEDEIHLGMLSGSLLRSNTSGLALNKQFAASSGSLQSAVDSPLKSNLSNPSSVDDFNSIHLDRSPSQAQPTGLATGSIRRIGHTIPHRFTLLRTPTMVRCDLCRHRVGVMERHLVCDDCNSIFHKRCAITAPASCGLPVEVRESMKLLAPSVDALDLTSSPVSDKSSINGSSPSVRLEMTKGEGIGKVLASTSPSRDFTTSM
ncbi:hypothetical protein SmJEL517_g02575 [Synchytrium microbalum]|uniref:Protein kinase domain-containing protein n=1 Tax=Synchytrium microbalum TaxID=1806994 RepID=A0A507BZY3_9FUNG|nr:uncharacterized protein SmJEL517_g02575 [Synchytrium microbalum]TPX34830.1 hypothetical protein SmJEL517_g02575 [Synchytrium microbalum]